MSEQILHSEAYKSFINSVDSEISKKGYRHRIKYFMRYCKVESYEELLQIATDPRKLEGVIRDYTLYLKENKLSSASIAALGKMRIY